MTVCFTCPSTASLSGHIPVSTANFSSLIVSLGSYPQPVGHPARVMYIFGPLKVEPFSTFLRKSTAYDDESVALYGGLGALHISKRSFLLKELPAGSEGKGGVVAVAEPAGVAEDTWKPVLP